jgi:hypothetical protein
MTAHELNFLSNGYATSKVELSIKKHFPDISIVTKRANVINLPLYGSSQLIPKMIWH